MKKITHSLVAMFALIATTAFAVDPVAVWSGFNNLESGTFTADIGSLVPDSTTGAVNLGSNGIKFANSGNAWAGSTKGWTVAVKYSTFASGTAAALVSLQQNSETSAAGIDKIGAWVNANGKVQGLWQAGSYGTANGMLPASGVVFVRYKDANGISVHLQNGTLLYADGGLKSSNNNWGKSFAVGSFANGTSNVAAGLTVEAVAIFDSRVSDADMAAYAFPDPIPAEYETVVLTNDNGTGSLGGVGNYQPDALLIPDSSGIEAGKIVKVKSVTFVLDSSSAASADSISINGEPSSSKTISGTWPNTSYPLVTYNYGDGVDIEIGKSAPMAASGDSRWRLFANVTDADRQYIGMTNTTDMNRGYRPAYKIVLEVPIGDVKNPSKAEITTNTAWADLDWDAKPTASDKAELTVSANATLTFDSTTAYQSLKLIGQRDLTIVGITSSNIGLVSKIKTTSFTGKLTFEIDASAGLTADTALKNYIRTASEKTTFVFKGSGNNGATLDYGYAVNAAIHSHIAFVGGTHAMTYGYDGSGADGNCFGINANNDNPTVLVTDKATLNFTAKDFSYWNGVADMSGVIRVDDGATLNFLANGRNTIYYRQRLCLEPGAKVTFPNTTGQNDSKPVMRFLGGTAENKEVIYVLPPTGSATTATISGDIFLPKDDTHGFGIFVSENSRLKWTGNMPVYDNNDDKAVVKRGAGVFEYYGTMDGVVQVLAGSIAGTGSFRKLTFNDSATLNLDNGTPTITGSLVTATEKQLKLAITPPVLHGMSVITLPAAADKTGWTAYVNDRAEANELTVDGNTLKLKWKIPPTIEVDIDDITIEPTSDWNGGMVKIDVSRLNKGDYKEDGDITYRLRFGDEKSIVGEVNDDVATFVLDDYFTAGNIYRGTFELGYGDAGDTITAADVIVYEGKLTYVEKDSWVNETPTTLGETGTYDPASGVLAGDDMIQINTNTKVTFTPDQDPDYVDKCDSSFTIQISADEAIDDTDQTIEKGAQAGVQIVADGNGGAIFQFIAGEKWEDGPAAELNELYEVTISFHYAKEEGDKDSVTYAVGEWKESYDRRANTANKVEEIIFYDGTQFASLVGTCQIEKADPVPQGMEPGAAEKELKATDETAAQTEAGKIPVVVPSEVEGDLTKGLDEAAAKEAKEKYKALFKVVAVKKGDKYVAEVVFTDKATEDIEKDEKGIVSAIVEAFGSLFEGEEGTLGDMEGRPGLYYGIATDGELVKMGKAMPEDWVIANGEGKIVGLKVKKTASAKQGFYKVICTPVKPATK